MTVTVFSEIQQRDLAWSLRPVTNSFLIFGIDLNVRQRSVYRRWALSVFGMLILCYLGYSYWKYFSNYKSIHKVEEAMNTRYVYFYIHVVSKTSFHMTIQVMLFTTAFFKWETLWNTVQEMEHFIRLPIRPYDQIRTAVTASTISFFVLVNYWHFNATRTWLNFVLRQVCILILESHMSNLVTFNGEIRYFLLATPGRLATYYFNCIVVVLFVVLTWFASLNIQLIADDVRNFRPKLGHATELRLNRWNKNYALISNVVEEIDRFFGPYLVVFTSKTFIVTINFAFNAVYSTFFQGNTDISGFLFLTCLDVLLLVIIVLAVEQMKKKVQPKTLHWAQLLNA